MKDMLKRIIDNVGQKGLVSAQAFEEAAIALGYTKDEINNAIREYDGFPIDDDDLIDIVGGHSSGQPYANFSNDFGLQPYGNVTNLF